MADAPAEERIGLVSRVRYRAVGEEGVLVHLASGRVVVVNEVGLYIVRLLSDAPRTKAGLAAEIAREFEVSAERAAADLEQYLAELDAEQVLERHA